MRSRMQLYETHPEITRGRTGSRRRSASANRSCFGIFRRAIADRRRSADRIDSWSAANSGAPGVVSRKPRSSQRMPVCFPAPARALQCFAGSVPLPHSRGPDCSTARSALSSFGRHRSRNSAQRLGSPPPPHRQLRHITAMSCRGAFTRAAALIRLGVLSRHAIFERSRQRHVDFAPPMRCVYPPHRQLLRRRPPPWSRTDTALRPLRIATPLQSRW